VQILRSNDRGQTEIGWLHSRHSFSFGEYHDPERMGFRSLRVINDDIVEPGMGFGTHGHRDMEIITLVLDGALEHKDSLGHGEVLRPGEVQVMTAGRGIRHSEFNPSRDDPAHFLQIWILPEAAGLPPAYAQRAFAIEARQNRLQRVAGRDGVETDGAIKINQDADVYLAELAPGQEVSHEVRPGRGIWIHVISGGIGTGNETLGSGDAAVEEKSGPLRLKATPIGASLVLFDLQ
jgi:quercetin 2,3-dioxygenase